MSRCVDNFALRCTTGVSRDEIVELFIHLEAYAGAARAFDSYQIAAAVFAEQN
jgi:4-carboxymuconolactone decarboxylase